MNKIVLSAKQKEVIYWMQKNCRLIKNITYVSLIGGNGCRLNTFYRLHDMKLIKPTGKYIAGEGTEYILTDLGKSIKTD